MEVSHQQRFSTEEEFESMMDPLPIMVRARGLNGEVHFANTAWKQFTGIFTEMNIHEDSRSAYEAAIKSHTELHKTFKATYRCSDKHGVYHWLAEQAVPWHSTDGKFLGFICYAMDIDDWMLREPATDTEALEREQAMNEELEAYNEELSATNEQLLYSQNSLGQANNNLEQILNMLPASVVVIRGHNLVVEMINSSNLTYWNKTKEEVLGKRFLAILPDLANQPFAGQLLHVMETGEVIDVKESLVLFTNADGSTRETYVDYTYQPLSDLDGHITGVLVMSFEITDRVLSRRLLEKYTEELASANAQLLVSNEQLAISESRFKYLIHEAPVAIGILHGRDLVLESANVKILEVWGKTPDIIGMPLSAALPELQGQPFLGILDEVYTSGKPFYANEIRSLLEHQGALKEIFFNVTYQPIADFSGSTADIMVVAVDVTEQVNARKQVERSEQHFRDLADLVPAKISNALPSGEVTFFNKKWLDYAGMGFDELRDFGYHNMMHPDEIPAFQIGLAKAATTGVPHVSEMRFKDTDGNYIWHLNIASPILDDEGTVTMWVGSTTDIQTLKEEEQRKSDFVSMLSHELKTPVTSIKGHIQLLLRALDKETPTALTDRIKPSLIRIDKLLVQLTRLISDMLDLTRIEADRLDLRKQPLMLDVLVAEVVEDFKLSHQHHQFHLRSENNIEVSADRDKISQVMINLIGNAIKYAPDSDVIDLSLSTAGDEVLIEVKDYGIGIDEKDQQKIFERFYRVEGQNEAHYSGFGIGLFLVNSIIERHGGYIVLESTKGVGSTFIVHLPISHE
ncbi:PAS domain S-box-containing protein [Pedobacter sp. CAN_A7]|uniref:PAS domain-containing protein n=1 Tax=Pedobacter sp. CAN_A7 TaxID=2787722 RepID=UPI0018C8FFEC